MASLLDKVNAQEKKEVKTPSRKKKASSPAKKIAAGTSRKDKMISAKVNSDVYTDFTRINQAYGISNNSALNMLIKEYVLSKKSVLEDD